MVVVDTNILAFLLIEGDRTEQAQALYLQDSDWRSEYFLLVEFANVLATTVRTRSLPPASAHDLLSQTQALLAEGLQLVAHTDALDLAIRYGISASDARFLAAARNLDARLVTEDIKLRAAAPLLTISLAEALG